MYDLVLINGRVVDGTGNPWFYADIAIEGDHIAAVGDLTGTSRTRTIDLAGAVVAPGFIDLHSHAEFTIPFFPRADALVRQGVTTVVTGNCGISLYPVQRERLEMLRTYCGYLDRGLSWEWSDTAEFATFLERQPLACNVALLVGHGTVRIAVMGFDDRAPTAGELAAMQKLTAQAFEQGAVGLSTGLVYSPGFFAETGELIALARTGRAYGAFYASHIRGESDALITAVKEAISIGKDAGVPVQLSHHKAMGKRNWGRVRETLTLIDEARAAGQDVLADQYPYTASSTGLAVFLPKWATEGGTEEMVLRLKVSDVRTRIRSEILNPSHQALQAGAREFSPETLMLSYFSEGRNKQYEGMRLDEVAVLRGEEPVDTVLGLLEEEAGKVGLVVHAMSEEDVRLVMRHPAVSVATDGTVLNPALGGKPHPRNYGTFARVLGKYVREEKLLPLEEAVRKMTSLPAQRLRHFDLGVVRRNCTANLVVFDPQQVRDLATFAEPHRFAVGIQHVIVNGQLVIENGEDTGVRAGRVMRRGQP